MAAMLMHDTLNAAGPKNAKNRKKHNVDNSLELFRTQGVHGGLWRSAYKLDSLGEGCALIYFAGIGAPYLAVMSVLGAGAGYYFMAF